VRQGGYSTIVMGGVRDPFILAELDSWLKQLDDGCGSATWSAIAVTRSSPASMVAMASWGALEPDKQVGGHEVFIL
jgi:hypothetical protein